MLDLFDYFASKRNEESVDLIYDFMNCTLRKDLDCYPSEMSKGDKVDRITVNFDVGVMKFSRNDSGVLRVYAELEITTKTNLLELS